MRFLKGLFSGSKSGPQFEVLGRKKKLVFVREISPSHPPVKTFELHDEKALMALQRCKPNRASVYAVDTSRCRNKVRIRLCNGSEFFVDGNRSDLRSLKEETSAARLLEDSHKQQYPTTVWKLDKKIGRDKLNPGTDQTATRISLPDTIENLKLVFPSSPVDLSKPVVISVFRNEADILDRFIEHYRDLGIRNFILIDNDSTDNSVEICKAKSRNDIAIFWTPDVYRDAKSGIDWSNAVLDHLGRFGTPWVLVVDSDEFLVLPDREQQDLVAACDALDQRHFEALCTPMIDLHSKSDISELGKTNLDETKFFDRSGYEVSGAANFPHFQLYGGPRSRTVGSRQFSLKKVALFKLVRGVRLKIGAHALTERLNLAPSTAALLHYKLSASLIEKVKREAIENRRTQTEHYRRYEELIETDFSFFDEHRSTEYCSPSDLIDAGLIWDGKNTVDLDEEDENAVRGNRDELDFLKLIPLLSSTES